MTHTLAHFFVKIFRFSLTVFLIRLGKSLDFASNCIESASHT